ncbi:hypothetical protein ANAPC1_00128 [Anaplasma phagocytophilum]|uniref:Major outer membrane protein P44-20 n=1 Tax=Anaplasma phagocytophilum TaxID=948 RepID=A0AA45US31_ANAPH|nr:hypothetical protein ANAPC1_00128 [Anaplasma phagocytophilum]
MKITNSTIDGKVCSGNHSKGAATNTPANFEAEPQTGGSNTTAQCRGLAVADTSKPFSKFVEDVKLLEGKNWPTGKVNKTTAVEGVLNGNAKAVATDLVALNPEEKTIVAGLLAKTIEGGEVVEIRAVSSTFVSI